MEWISVKDRLPEEGQAVVALDAFAKDLSFAVLFIIRGLPQFWCVKGEDIEDINVTHWMPLPEPPKEEEDATS